MFVGCFRLLQQNKHWGGLRALLGTCRARSRHHDDTFHVRAHMRSTLRREAVKQTPKIKYKVQAVELEETRFELDSKARCSVPLHETRTERTFGRRERCWENFDTSIVHTYVLYQPTGTGETKLESLNGL